MALASSLIGAAASAASVPVGIVEGFYGPPWSHQDRLDIIEFMGRHGMNIYLYGPKDDPQHRSAWREPYADAQMAEFRELVAACQANGVDFCFAMSPGENMTYSDPEEQRILLDKMMCLAPDGVDHFALFLDDIDVERMGAADRERFATPVEAQMFLANALHDQIMARNPEAFFVICPTLYLGVEPAPYWDTLRTQLNPDVAVIWTGIDVVAPTITDEHLDAITRHFGRPPFIWDNYPVNDFARGQLYLGPVVGRAADLPQRISGYAANPMLQAHASMIALATIGYFFRDPEHYDPEASWNRAIDEIGGEAADDLRVFADQCRPCGLASAESESLTAAVNAYRADPSPANSAALAAQIAALRGAAERLPSTLPPALASEVSPWIEALGERALAMELAQHFIEGIVVQRGSLALLRYINRVRASEHSVAVGPSERLFEMAVGLSTTWRGTHSLTHAVNAVDPPVEGQYPGSRGPDQLIIYTPAYAAPSTSTNPWGFEAVVRNGAVVSAVREGDSSIPADGFVVSGHGTAAAWIRTNLLPDTPVEFSSDEVRWGDVPLDRLSPARRVDVMRVRLLDALAVLVERQAPAEVLDVARLVLREIEGTLSDPGQPATERLDAIAPRLAQIEALAEAAEAAPE